MGINMWCFIASVFLVFVEVELYTVSPSYYERPQSTSPAPEPSQPQTAELTGMKEVVLFLTPDQVETLKAAGAVVRPYPEYASEYAEVQQQFKQSTEQQNVPQYQTSTQNEDQKQDAKLENYYKLLNIQEINDDLAQQPTTQVTTEKTTTTPRYKYTKSRQQNKAKENFTPYVPKKGKSKSSNQNTEYVRFLPNYERENLKMIPYPVIPLSPYRYEQVQEKLYTHVTVQGNERIPTNDQEQRLLYSQATNEDSSKSDISTNEETQANDDAELNTEDEPITPSSLEEESDKSEALEEIPAPVITWRPKTSQTQIQGQDFLKYREALASLRERIPLERQQEKPESPVTATDLKQDQFSRLLAPLYQHQSITEAIAAQKRELLQAELQIHKNLEEIKKAPEHSNEEYAKIVEQLAENLEKQNALAKIEAISKSTTENNKRRPIELVRQTEPQDLPKSLEAKEPVPKAASTKYTRPIPVPVLQTEKVTEKSTPVNEGIRSPVPVSKNVYYGVDNPQIVKKVVSDPVNDEIPINYQIFKPEKLTIIRHIWEH